jgi:hypothetical protein
VAIYTITLAAPAFSLRIHRNWLPFIFSLTSIFSARFNLLNTYYHKVQLSVEQILTPLANLARAQK